MRWHSWSRGKVVRWQFGKDEKVVSREVGMEFKEKSCYIAPGKRNVSWYSLQVFDNSYIMFYIILFTLTSVA